MGSPAASQAAFRDSPPTAAPAGAARPGKFHTPTPRGTSCDTPAAAPAAATRSATLTCTGRVA